MEVTVRIDPEHAESPSCRTEVTRGARDRPRGERVVPAQHDGEATIGEGRRRAVGDVGADLGDGAEVASATLGAARRIYAEGHGDVARVLDVVAEGDEPLTQVGVADGGGPHVHPAARGAEVHRHTEESDGSHTMGANGGAPGPEPFRMGMRRMPSV